MLMLRYRGAGTDIGGPRCQSEPGERQTGCVLARSWMAGILFRDLCLKLDDDQLSGDRPGSPLSLQALEVPGKCC